MGVVAAPAESPPVLRGPREVCADKTRPIQITVAAPTPSARGRPREFALTSAERTMRKRRGRFRTERSIRF